MRLYKWTEEGLYDIIGGMKILAIESSCDETAAAVIADGRRILSNVVVSQIDIFAEYGGVIPEVAARSHLEAIVPVIHKAMWDVGNLGKDDIDAIAVTHTPGLLGSLLIGTLTARMLAVLWGKPLFAVHHLKSHIYANWLEAGIPANYVTPEFPLLALVVSGGHTQIIYMKEHNHFEIIGTTRDDAVGECFDKVAKILGLPYPGGPSIAKVALNSRISSLNSVSTQSQGRESSSFRSSSLPRTSSNSPATRVDSKFEAIDTQEWYKKHPNYKLPHPKVEGLDFSFSGLKTAVLRAVQAECGVSIRTPSFELAEKLSDNQKADFAAAFQETACEILINKLEMALEAYPEVRSVVIAGGVSANKVLREKALERILEGSEGKIGVFFPALQYAGDNAAMVGAAAYFEAMSGVKPTDHYKLNIAPRTPIG